MDVDLVRYFTVDYQETISDFREPLESECKNFELEKLLFKEVIKTRK